MSCVCFVLLLFPFLSVNAILACFDVLGNGVYKTENSEKK